MQTPGSDPRQRAQQVCGSCKARKRKCDKALPQCSHCIKKKLKCSYSKPDQTRSPNPDTPWYSPSADDANSHVESIDYPTMLFLDPCILQRGQIDSSPATVTIPPLILDLLGDIEGVRLTAERYFARVHLWMPFISKKHFYDIYLRPYQRSLPTHPDIILLFLVQKLITTPPPASPQSPRTPLYLTAKHFYLDVESSSVFSVLVLQAGILLALYEVGHAIYPAAYLTIGACARYAYALGIQVQKVMTRKAVTMVEVEERRRVWWAIVILDRFVNIGCPGRPFATPEPTLDDLLPADDAGWDQGIVTSDTPATLSSPLTSHMSKYALLCQAARLLGQVLNYISNYPDLDEEVGLQLDRTLNSMLAVALNVEQPDYDQITFIFSALVALYTPTFRVAGASFPSANFHAARFERAISVDTRIMEHMMRNSNEDICPLVSRPPEEMSPWGCFFAYQVCAVHLKVKQRDEEIVEFFKRSFAVIDRGWRVAGVYLRLLEAQEALGWA